MLVTVVVVAVLTVAVIAVIARGVVVAFMYTISATTEAAR